jgi:urease accessory protein
MEFRKCLIGLSLAAMSAAAFAHPGHASGFWEAFMHPILGWDHLLAMFIVGLLAVRYSGWETMVLPSIFVASLIGSSALVSAFQLPVGASAEALVLLSVVLLGALLAFRESLSLPILSLVVAFAGLAHGAVHGVELGMENSLAILGLAVATGSLHATGYFVARVSQRYVGWLSRIVGYLASAAGLVALVTRFSFN